MIFGGRLRVTKTTDWRDPQSADNVDDGDGAWSNPANILASDDSYAGTSGNDGTGGDSDLLRAYNFDFSEVGGSILGVEVRYERKENAVPDPPDVHLQLLGASGTLTGNAKVDSSVPSSDAYASFGGSSDLWGASLDAATVKDSDFGVGIRRKASGSIASIIVDHVQMRVTYRS